MEYVLASMSWGQHTHERQSFHISESFRNTNFLVNVDECSQFGFMTISIPTISVRITNIPKKTIDVCRDLGQGTV